MSLIWRVIDRHTCQSIRYFLSRYFLSSDLCASGSVKSFSNLNVIELRCLRIYIRRNLVKYKLAYSEIDVAILIM